MRNRNRNRNSKNLFATLLFLLGVSLVTSVAWADSEVQNIEPQAEVKLEACVSARQVRNIEVIDEQMLVLRGTADRFWLSRLPNKCAGLEDRMYLSIERYGSKICANDRFTASESSGFRMSCRFGKFEPVVQATVAAVKVAAAEQ
ncbi:MAG: hypothetical protein ACI9ON_002025 [Limisphaerales bacterium]